MTTTTIGIESREQWLVTRAQDVTSTESPALFGLSPYVTDFELWHRKRDGIVEDAEPSDRMRWGLRLQDAIARGVGEDMGWSISPANYYQRDEQDRMGSSFDFEALHPDLGRGLMEIKNVAGHVFSADWIETDDGIEAPQHIELQVQHQMEVADLPWCAIVALVGGNDAKVTVRLRDRIIGREIRSRVRAFWASIAEGTPPKPDYKRDAEFLRQLYGKANDGETIDADHEVEALLSAYAIARKDEEAAESHVAELRAKVLERIGTASKVKSRFGTLSCGVAAASEGKLITPEMVGTRIGARAAFRQFRFTAKKEK